ncbi:MAG: hypothetical protein RR561_01205 [Peptostreptococcus sp.]|uniref:hypothetical protein n=1 Tax=Peptostreptococcus sp. TaxID=1262 RepID=UPI002FC97D1B
MTAKKDLKKKKSKKKANKTNSKPNRNLGADKVEKQKPIAEVVSKDKSIAIISLIQTSLVMALSIAMILAKPGKGIGQKIIDQNIFLSEKILTNSVLIAFEIIIVVFAVFFVYKSLKNAKLKKFYYTGIVLLTIAFAYCVTQSVDNFAVYSYGVIVALLVAILQMVKLRFISRIEVTYKDEEVTEA